jgi:hypothetical protein
MSSCKATRSGVQRAAARPSSLRRGKHLGREQVYGVIGDLPSQARNDSPLQNAQPFRVRDVRRLLTGSGQGNHDVAIPAPALRRAGGDVHEQRRAALGRQPLIGRMPLAEHILSDLSSDSIRVLCDRLLRPGAGARATALSGRR